MDLNHQKELFSIAMSTAVISQAKCNWSQQAQDHGIDLTISGEGWELCPEIRAQLKATSDFEIIKEADGVIKYPLRVKNYNDLIKNTMVPRILILAIVPSNPDLWCRISNFQMSLGYGLFWKYLSGYPATENGSKVTIDIPLENRFSHQSLSNMMSCLNEKGELML